MFVSVMSLIPCLFGTTERGVTGANERRQYRVGQLEIYMVEWVLTLASLLFALVLIVAL